MDNSFKAQQSQFERKIRVSLQSKFVLCKSCAIYKVYVKGLLVIPVCDKCNQYLFQFNCPHSSTRSEVFLGKSLLKICSEFIGEHPCRSVVSIKLLYKFFEITLRHGRSPVNLLHIFKTPFPKKTSGRLLLYSVDGK